jgi:GntR family transcriptional regulator/MocR family aminotransferase
MDLFTDAASGRGLSAQLYEQIRDGIATGRLGPGEQLPPSRHLAQQLGLSRHTVTTAYGRLAAEGFIQGRAGGGSIVAGVPASAPLPVPRPSAIIPSRRFAGWTPEPGPLNAQGCRFDLRAGMSDPGLFPAQAWRRRLIAADETTVIVTSGAQHAVDLVARVLLEPGDTVAIEDPGYPPVVSLFRSLGANVISVRIHRRRGTRRCSRPRYRHHRPEPPLPCQARRTRTGIPQRAVTRGVSTNSAPRPETTGTNRKKRAYRNKSHGVQAGAS